MSADEIKTYRFDDDLLEEVAQTGKPALKIYSSFQRLVVIGKGSDADKEIYLDRCRKDRIDIYRRHGGGCAVFLDPGNVIVSLAYSAKGIGQNDRHFRIISRWIIEALAGMGIEGLSHEGHSDLAQGDRKVGGACIYRSKNILYYSVSLLVEADIASIGEYIKYPPKEPSYRKGRPHERFVKCIEPSYITSQMIDSLEKRLDIDDLVVRIDKAKGGSHENTGIRHPEKERQ